MARLLTACLLIALSWTWPAQAQEAPRAVPVEETTQLREDDVVRLEVFGEDDLTTQTRIMKSGEAVFPLIGAVKISGLTISEAIEAVRFLYADKYLVDPKVRLTIDQRGQQFFSVIGAVNNAGQFPIPPAGQIDLSAALATAGGLNELADRSRIVLSRADGGSSTYSAAQAEGGAKIPVRSGDRIVVQQSRFVGKSITLLGQVRKPGPLPMPVDGRLDIISAIASAGGFTELANPKKVSINRGGRVTLLNVKEMTESGDTPYYLQPNDIITVAERFF